MYKIIDFAKNYKISKEGVLIGMKGVMTPTLTSQGYLRVRIKCDDGKVRGFLFHRLMALMFIPNPENKPQINHKNGIKSDNRLENLEWVTALENQLHALRTGLKRKPRGELNARNILSENEVVSIYYELLNGARIIDVCKRYGVYKSTISSIKSKQNWKYLLESLPDIEHKKKKHKLSDETVVWVCKEIEKGVCLFEIIKKCLNKSITIDNLRDIKRRKNFKHISKDYNW